MLSMLLLSHHVFAELTTTPAYKQGLLPTAAVKLSNTGETIEYFASCFIAPATAAKRARMEDDARCRSIETFTDLANKYFAHSPAVRRIIEEDGEFSVASASVEAMLVPKASATLQKRTTSLRIYAAWFEAMGAPAAEFCQEVWVYRYAKYLLEEGAPASRAQACREAMNFAGGLLELSMEDLRASRRLHGLCIKSLRTRGETRQRKPLTAKLLTLLEDIVLNAAPGDFDAIVAGAALMATFGRCRVGDLRRCSVDPVADIAPLSWAGTLETRFITHKTARAGSSRALPIAASAFGLRASEGSWGTAWLAHRRAAGLRADVDGTILPAYIRGVGWSSVAYTTAEFAAAFRGCLLRAGASLSDLENIGAHSLKASMLSWAAKFGVSLEARRLLGYHVSAGDKSALVYSRDAMAGPLRMLDEVIVAVRAGTFVPDLTRSGRFVDVEARASDDVAPDNQSEATVASTRSSSSSSSTAVSLLGEEDHVEHVEVQERTLVQNKRTGFIHVCLDADKLRCGKKWPAAFLCLDDLPAGASVCSRCF